MLFGCFGSEVLNPVIREYGVDCVVRWADVSAFYIVHHWSCPYIVNLSDAYLSLYFERPTYAKEDVFVLRNITYTIPDLNEYSTYISPVGKKKTIAFYQNLSLPPRVELTRETPLKLAMSNWEVMQPHTRYATLCPQNFKMNDVAYTPSEKQPVYGQYERLVPC